MDSTEMVSMPGLTPDRHGVPELRDVHRLMHQFTRYCGTSVTGGPQVDKILYTPLIPRVLFGSTHAPGER